MTLKGECDVIMELIKKCVEENAHSAIDQSDYMIRYTALLERYETAKNRLKTVNVQWQEHKIKRENISRFICSLKRTIHF